MLNILILHGMGPRATWFSGVSDVELMFPKYDKSSNYWSHNCYSKIPNFLKTIHFDSIIIMSTFMDFVVQKGSHSIWLKQYEFIKSSDAIKIVFAQDDYWLSEVRDEFYNNFKIDVLYSVCPVETWCELFPKFLRSSGDVRQGFTSYVTPAVLSLQKYDIAWMERSYDVVYRAKKVPSAPNYLGYIKGIMGEKFLEKTKDVIYKFDISTDPKKLIFGEKWYKFLCNSKSTLGSNSGSSVLLRNATIETSLREYQSEYPEASWEEVAINVFDKKDLNKKYTALSPRNIEAAMLGTLQILTPGEYSNILIANEHFLVLDENFENSEQVLIELNRVENCQKMINSCRETILRTPELQFEVLLKEVKEIICTKKRTNLSLENKFRYIILKLVHGTHNETVVFLKWVILKFPKYVFSKFTPKIKNKIKRKINNILS
jgi:hypothetical protein